MTRKLFRNEEVVQEGSLKGASVVELPRDVCVKNLTYFALKLHLVSAGCDMNSLSDDSSSCVIQICVKCVRNRKPHVGRAVQHTVISEMSLEDLAICVVPQDCRKIRQRQIHVDPPLVQQSRSVQHVEILNGKFKPGRLLKDRSGAPAASENSHRCRSG